ncbi:MAG TPA: phosphopantetheine-binding protein [Acidobacteriota bacterium]|nr:acyl carrier protein [Acidobacteriota bacterium]MCS5702734.1 phosphopantetheine-binding protein [Acidobacteriota bacterium]MEE2649002.1 phosphopantetheine-binding protein [Acidobacteriota bacterium]MEE3150689.1 phosphopantetheine-binding protein [Acidobacteriota bacterium]HJN47556.1 phosphopantetheine-binding protein [Acidobacteriota bacterium]
MSSIETVKDIKRLIVELKPEVAGKITDEARLQSEIGLTSVEIIDLVIAAEDEFEIEIPDDDTGELMDATVIDLALRVESLINV